MSYPTLLLARLLDLSYLVLVLSKYANLIKLSETNLIKLNSLSNYWCKVNLCVIKQMKNYIFFLITEINIYDVKLLGTLLLLFKRRISPCDVKVKVYFKLISFDFFAIYKRQIRKPALGIIYA